MSPTDMTHPIRDRDALRDRIPGTTVRSRQGQHDPESAAKSHSPPPAYDLQILGTLRWGAPNGSLGGGGWEGMETVPRCIGFLIGVCVCSRFLSSLENAVTVATVDWQRDRR